MKTFACRHGDGSSSSVVVGGGGGGGRRSGLGKEGETSRIYCSSCALLSRIYAQKTASQQPFHFCRSTTAEKVFFLPFRPRPRMSSAATKSCKDQQFNTCEETNPWSCRYVNYVVEQVVAYPKGHPVRHLSLHSTMNLSGATSHISLLPRVEGGAAAGTLI